MAHRRQLACVIVLCVAASGHTPPKTNEKHKQQMVTPVRSADQVGQAKAAPHSKKKHGTATQNSAGRTPSTHIKAFQPQNATQKVSSSELGHLQLQLLRWYCNSSTMAGTRAALPPCDNYAFMLKMVSASPDSQPSLLSARRKAEPVEE